MNFLPKTLKKEPRDPTTDCVETLLEDNVRIIHGLIDSLCFIVNGKPIYDHILERIDKEVSKFNGEYLLEDDGSLVGYNYKRSLGADSKNGSPFFFLKWGTTVPENLPKIEDYLHDLEIAIRIQNEEAADIL